MACEENSECQAWHWWYEGYPLHYCQLSRDRALQESSGHSDDLGARTCGGMTVGNV